jgi:hypothetical protein
MKKSTGFFQVSEWPLVLLTIFVVVVVNQLI